MRAAALIAVCAGVAALTTALPWALAFDPEAWLVWGREALRLELATEGGPSWKPLPVAVTTVLAPLGDATPWAWLVVARTGALLALAGAAALTLRLTGSRAAAAAAGALVALSPWWAHNAALGNSEGLLAALVLWAAWAHLGGRTAVALALGLGAALLRPEAWPFLGLYALWLWRAEPPRRPAIAGGLLLVPVAWCVPELLSSGEPFRAADAALGTPSAEAAARADLPWLEVLGDAAQLMTIPVAVGLAAGLARAAAARDRAVLALGGGALAWAALVSAMTAAGFAGTPRYSVPAAALAAVVAATLARAALPALALVVLVAALQAGDLDAQREDVAARAHLRDSLRAAVDADGGAEALRACGPVRTERTRTTTVAWHLDLPIAGLASPPRPGDTVLAVRDGSWAIVSPRCRP